MDGHVIAGDIGRVERVAYDVCVPTFDSIEDDFEEWVELFEKAVKLASNVRDDAGLHYLYKQWLPLKLDSVARAAHKQVADGEWPTLKEALASLLVDPQEKARWQAKKTTIKWDGKESFHALASRIKRAVDKNECGMPDEFLEREYYQRFKNAFKKPMRRVIACNCPEGERTIDAAREVALRYHIAITEDDSDDAKDGGKSTTFASGSFQPDRLTGIENAIFAMTTQLENMSVTLRDREARFRSIEDRLSELEQRRWYREYDDDVHDDDSHDDDLDEDDYGRLDFHRDRDRRQLRPVLHSYNALQCGSQQSGNVQSSNPCNNPSHSNQGSYQSSDNRAQCDGQAKRHSNNNHDAGGRYRAAASGPDHHGKSNGQTQCGKDTRSRRK